MKEERRRGSINSGEIFRRALAGDKSILNSPVLDEAVVAAIDPTPIPASGAEQFHIALDELREMDPSLIHAAFITVLTKSPKGEFCESCNRIHTVEGVAQTLVVISPLDILGPLVRSGLHHALQIGAEKCTTESDGMVFRGSVVYSAIEEGGEIQA